MDEQQIESRSNFLHEIINTFITQPPAEIAGYVDTLRNQNAGISNDDLADKIISRKSFKNGLVGAVTGVGGLLTLPITVPADVALSWKIQITMALAIAKVYGHTNATTDLKTDIYLILAGDSAKEAIKRIGIQVGETITKKAIDKYITREVMEKIWSVIGRKIITKLGQRSATSFMKLVPLIGAPIGFVFDWVSAKAVGHIAKKYYSGK